MAGAMPNLDEAFEIGLDEKLIAVIDFHHVPYAYLRDSFVQELSKYAKRLAARNLENIVILVAPRPFPAASLFWLPFTDKTSNGKSIIVISSSSEIKCYGSDMSKAVPAKALKDLFVQNIDQVRTELQSLVVRKMGHFHFEDDSCSPYYWDASEATSEVAQLFVAMIEGRTASALNQLPFEKRKSFKQQYLIAVPSRSSSWLKEVAQEIVTELPNNSQVQTVQPDSGPWEGRNFNICIPLLDVVTKGTHLKELLNWAKKFDTPYGATDKFIFPCTVFASQVARQEFHELYYLEEFPDTRVPSQSCEQCRIGLSFVEHDDIGSEPLQIRAYDMWAMLSSVTWKPEVYGPRQARTNKQVFAVMEELIKKNQPYLSYKFQRRLSEDIGSYPCALIAPNEPAIMRFLHGLPEVRRGKYQTVFVGRKAIDSTNLYRTSRRDQTPTPEWEQQLELVYEKGMLCVLVDEFCSSNGTFKSLLSICGQYGLRPLTCLPIINRSSQPFVGSTPIHALYEFPWPREGLG